MHIDAPIRRGTKYPQKVLEARDRRQFERPPADAFKETRLFRGIDGIVYSTAKSKDPIYKVMALRNAVDQISIGGLPAAKRRRVLDQFGTEGLLFGKVLLYAKMPRDRKRHATPTGTLTMTEPSTGQLFSATVTRSRFVGRAKTGFVVVDNMIGWGAMSDASQFPSSSRKRRRLNVTGSDSAYS